MCHETISIESILSVQYSIFRAYSVESIYNEREVSRPRIQYVQRRVFDQYRQRSSTTPRTVDLRSMAIRKRRKFSASKSSAEINDIVLGSRELKFRKHRARHGFARATTPAARTSTEVIDIESRDNVSEDNSDNESEVVTNDVENLPNIVISVSENSRVEEEEDNEEEPDQLLESFELQEVNEQIMNTHSGEEVDSSSDASEYFDEAFDADVVSKEYDLIDDDWEEIIDEAEDNSDNNNVTDESITDETTYDPLINL